MGEREDEACRAGKRIEMSEQKGRLGQVGQRWVGGGEEIERRRRRSNKIMENWTGELEMKSGG